MRAEKAFATTTEPSGFGPDGERRSSPRRSRERRRTVDMVRSFRNLSD